MIVAVGSLNKAKIAAVKHALALVFPQKSIQILPTNVPSGVCNQPMDDNETIKGARNRANQALKANPTAHFAIGIEGFYKIQPFIKKGWIAVVDRNGKVGLGSSASYQISNKILIEIKKGKELGDVVDKISNLVGVRQGQGMMGLVTNGLVNRDVCYNHGIIFAFAPFISDSVYWDADNKEM